MIEMKSRLSRVVRLAVVMMAVASWPALHAQYREYYIFGKVLDLQKQPLPDVEITLREKSTSQGFALKTDKKGEFRFVGLPHGVYDVQFIKEGYQTKADEWKFESMQDRMVRIEIPAITMVTESQLREMQLNQKLDAQFKTALELMQKHDFEAAASVLKAMLEQKADDSNALYMLGVALNKQKKHEEAIAVLERVAPLNPNFAGIPYQLGMAYHQLGRNDQALENYRRTLELQPQQVEVRFNAGLLLFQMNRPAEALAQFEAALQLKGDDPESLEMAGRCCIQLERFEEAVEYLEKAKPLQKDAEKARFLQETIDKLKPAMKK